MSRERTRPSAVILDLLHSARGRQQTAVALIEAGALFGFSENTIRVTLSRLMARGRIESPSRGLYRLSRQTHALNDFVERWRLGEARVRPWQPGQWLFAHQPELSPDGFWALDALGFREVRPGLLARPDNLALEAAELLRLAEGIGLDAGTLLVRGEPGGDPLPAAWIAWWDPPSLNADYRNAVQRLRASAARLPKLPDGEARLECFRLGGEMIHRLAKDPLLPAELVDVEARDALCRAMLAYDLQGKKIWADMRHGELRHMPHPQMAAGPQAS